MLSWTLCFLCLSLGLRGLFDDLGRLASGPGRERAQLKAVCALLQELEESLAAGLLPAGERWSALAALPAPWGALASESLEELRSRGGALLPTLRRLRALAQDHDSSLAEARARSSQALAQALVCSLLVPLFGAALYALMPAVEQRPWLWWGACGAALGSAGIGAHWMLNMAERARWAGLPPEARPWVLASQCAGERFLALVRSGNPADLAWVRACALLEQEAPGLAARWGASVWRPGAEGGTGATTGARAKGPAERALAAERALEDAGAGLRKAVQVSLMEGRPCTDRVEAALLGLRQDLRVLVERELGLLGTRALKPLFLCVAPGLFVLLGLGLWLTWEQSGGRVGF